MILLSKGAECNRIESTAEMCSVPNSHHQILLNLPSPLFVLRMMVHSIRLPIFLLFFFVTLEGDAQTKQAADTLLLLFGSYLPKLQEVSRPLSIGLMAPNEVLVGANIPSAHPSLADVPCRLAFCGRHTDTIVPRVSPSTGWLATARPRPREQEDYPWFADLRVIKNFLS